eukprot:3638106-Alexandrium_andersonii.AAC.1
MSASLVGSEMCIRDRHTSCRCLSCTLANSCRWVAVRKREAAGRLARGLLARRYALPSSAQCSIQSRDR